MNTWIWENEKLSDINAELEQLIDNRTVNTILSMSLVATEDPIGSLSLYSAILIYE